MFDVTPANGSDGNETGQHHAAKLVAVVAVLLAVLVVAVAVLWSGASTARPGAAPTSEAASSTAGAAPQLVPPPEGCPSLAARSGAEASVVGHDSSLPVRLLSASYLVDKAFTPARVSRAGRLEGSIPAGRQVWLLSYARDDTFDSTPERNPGSGRAYPIGPIETADGCWSLSPRALGYAEALGITYDQYVVLADAAAAKDFADELAKQERGGFSLDEVGLRDAPVIAVFAIPTQP